MGTSISQSSPRNTNWGPVHAGYEHKNIPEKRIVRELWRATDNDPTPISSHLKSSVVYDCFNAVISSINPADAMQKLNSGIMTNKNNSIVAEFAKRAVVKAFQSSSPATEWPLQLFSEVTNYILSRDTSGFVGENYRNKTVSNLIEFKKNITSQVRDVVARDKTVIKTKKEWHSFVDKAIDKLKSAK